MSVSVNQLRFTQPFIRTRFKDGRNLPRMVQEIVANPDFLLSLPPLRVVKNHDSFLSLDNRRLACCVIASAYLKRPLKMNVQIWNRAECSRSKCQRGKLQFAKKSRFKGRAVQVKGFIEGPDERKHSWIRIKNKRKRIYVIQHLNSDPLHVAISK